jgi:hypothetical protein
LIHLSDQNRFPLVTTEPAGVEEDEELDPEVMAALGCEYLVRAGDEAIKGEAPGYR